MRKHSLLLFGYFIALLFFVSCSKKNDTGNSNASAITSLTIAVDKSTITADGFDKATFTVLDQNSRDVTGMVLIEINGMVISGNTIIYQPYESTGSFPVKAKKGTVVSNTITLNVVAAGTAKYSTKVIAEDCTGAWCGWCPRLTWKFDNFMHNNNRIFTIGVHNGDAFALSSIESALRAKFSITSFPSAIINRDRKFNDNGNINSFADSTDLGDYLRARAPLGLSLSSTVNGNTLNITTKVGFDANISNNLKLVVCVVEDGLILGQTNYYNNNNNYPGNPYYSAGATITNFVHNGVLRAAPTGIFGESIPKANQIKNGEYSATHAVNINSWNVAKLKVVAFVTYDTDKETSKGILNAQWTNANTTKNYD